MSEFVDQSLTRGEVKVETDEVARCGGAKREMINDGDAREMLSAKCSLGWIGSSK